MRDGKVKESLSSPFALAPRRSRRGRCGSPRARRARRPSTSGCAATPPRTAAVRNTAATWVITDVSSVAVAYVSISVTSIDRGSAPEAIAKHAPDPVPALLIGRLAVDRTVAGLGVGTALAAHVLATAVDLNQQAACRAVVVSTLDDHARTWWERLGFRAFAPDDRAGLNLYLLTTEIEATLRHLG